MKPIEIPDKDQPLREDIRLLGRVLGDTIRQQQGEAVFAIVERIRQISIRFRRDEDEARPPRARGRRSTASRPTAPSRSCARSAISRTSPTSPRTSTTSAAPARTRYAGVGAARGTMRACADAARDGRHRPRDSCRRFFDTTLVIPVLTAHPTEVRRKSMLDREMEVARAPGRARPHASHARGGGRRATKRMRRAVLTLWQTSLLRRDQADVLDEVANGLVLLRPHVPARTAALLRRRSKIDLAADDPGWNNAEAAVLPPDGQLDRRRPRRQSVRQRRRAAQTLEMQSKRAFDFYLDELHLLGGELSLDARRVSISAQLAGAGRAFARHVRRAAPTSPTAAPSPASMRGWSRPRADSARSRLPRHAVGEATPYANRRRAARRSRHRSTARCSPTARR